MEPRTRLEAKYEKRHACQRAEQAGEIADSMEVRQKLIDQMKSGEKSLAEIQSELNAIKHSAKRNGKLTRQQVWSRS